VESKLASLKGKGTEIHEQFMSDKKRLLEVQQKEVQERQNHEQWEQQKEIYEAELIKLREFHSKYSYLENPKDKEFQTTWNPPKLNL